MRSGVILFDLNVAEKNKAAFKVEGRFQRRIVRVEAFAVPKKVYLHNPTCRTTRHTKLG
jgi:hypothetical protein